MADILASGLREQAPRLVAPAPAASAATAGHRTDAAADRAASAAARLNAAKTELAEASSASMRANLACKAAAGNKSAERHQLRLAHKAAIERVTIAHAAVDRCQSEFNAAFRDFQNVG